MSIEIMPLGAGREVGRSCIIVRMSGKTIMFDCGVHMGYDDNRRYPDFSLLGQVSDYTPIVDCVLITHFHLDHCGALPHFTEMKGYHGPILMSAPTRAILPLMLEDFRKVAVEHKGDSSFVNLDMIKECVGKVTTIDLHQTLTVAGNIKVTAYYAGHVLGAVMFHVECEGLSVVYTGDYNMVGDRHLKAAWIDRLKPHVVISESTYGTKFRELKMKREKLFLKKVNETIERGGKVLVPVFALGRAQELCILLDTYWERTGIEVPVHFAGTLTEKANHFYKTFIQWCNENVQRVLLRRNMFDFQHITQFDRKMIKSKEPMVLFSTPGMLHGGLSLSVFKEWCGDAKNTIVIPGYCVPGTVGHAILTKREVTVHIEGKEYPVRCEVMGMSFSAHTDHRGILQLINWLQPENVVLVHGEQERMMGLKAEIEGNLQLPCYCPANHENISIPCPVLRPVSMDYEVLQDVKSRCHELFADQLFENTAENGDVAGCLNESMEFETSSEIFMSCEVNSTLEEIKARLEEIGNIADKLEMKQKAGKVKLKWPLANDREVNEFLNRLESS